MGILKFKKVNCKNCYKCIRYCPVKAIAIKDNQAQILEDQCILCGNCTVVCPQNAKEDENDVPKIKALLKGGHKVIATVAPSFIAVDDFPNFEALSNALKVLGFYEIKETAEGAFRVKTKYEELVKESDGAPIISSCCPTVNMYIEKYYPEALPYLAPVTSPMEATARSIKNEYTDSIVVFIGPCISKKDECIKLGNATDYAITFEELLCWLNEENIEVFPSEIEDLPKYKSRLFPVSGGILNSMKKEDNFDYIAVDGIDNCMSALNEVVNGSIKNCFIEMSACVGSCVGGPYFQKHNKALLASRIKVENNALNKNKDTDYTVTTEVNLQEKRNSMKLSYSKPTEQQLLGILKKMGKNSTEDELNCGTCGYATCRDKAAAVFQGKADITMCLPFIKERAESFSDKIINVTPNLVIAVDLDLKVQQINKAACEVFGIKREADILGSPVSRILDEFDFVDMITSSKSSMKKNSFLVEYNVYLEQVYLYDKSNSIIICIMKNITGEKRIKNEVKEKKLRAAKMADDIVEKQLRIVQEIASLLGETAAETQIAVTDLKDSILMEE